MKESAGLLILKDNKILLCHPTNASWNGTYSIPKGGLDVGESKIDAAVRETMEEVGIIIPIEYIKPKEHIIEYKDKKGKLFKKVYYYIVEIDNIPDILPKSQLQSEEVDWAGFLDYEEAKNKIFWRFKPMLEHLK